MKSLDIAVEALADCLRLAQLTDGDYLFEIQQTAREALAEIRKNQYLEGSVSTVPDVLKETIK